MFAFEGTLSNIRRPCLVERDMLPKLEGRPSLPSFLSWSRITCLYSRIKTECSCCILEMYFSISESFDKQSMFVSLKCPGEGAVPRLRIWTLSVIRYAVGYATTGSIAVVSSCNQNKVTPYGKLCLLCFVCE